MTPELAAMRAKLVARWGELPDNVSEADAPDQCRRAVGLVKLIGWIDCNPDSDMPTYRAYLAKVQEEK